MGGLIITTPRTFLRKRFEIDYFSTYIELMQNHVSRIFIRFNLACRNISSKKSLLTACSFIFSTLYIGSLCQICDVCHIQQEISPENTACCAKIFTPKTSAKYVPVMKNMSLNFVRNIIRQKGHKKQ